MPEPTLLIPGLASTPQFYAAQIPALWHFGPVMLAQHTGADDIAAIARDMLASAPPSFALAGHSMGGYIAFEIVRQAPRRITRLAMIGTSALADTAEQTARRRQQMAIAAKGRYDEIVDQQFPLFVHASRQHDVQLRATMHRMANDCGAEVFVRQQAAIIGRADSRPTLVSIACPTCVVVGDSDQLTPPARAQEIAIGIAGATLVTIRDCGHMSAIERPDEVTAALCAWKEA
ncbi:MAG: alpha/beta fold hydrolase [Casimicrobiaceae bacterium]